MNDKAKILTNPIRRLQYCAESKQSEVQTMMNVFGRITRSFLFSQVVLLCILGCSCGNPKPSSKTPTQALQTLGTPGGTVTYKLSSPPTTFNYLLAADESSVMTSFFLLNSRLIDFDHRTQKYVPALAESWNTDADGVTVKIKLRDGLKFSDGSELTSDDVVFTLKAIYDERTHSPAWKDSMLIGGRS